MQQLPRAPRTPEQRARHSAASLAAYHAMTPEQKATRRAYNTAKQRERRNDPEARARVAEIASRSRKKAYRAMKAEIVEVLGGSCKICGFADLRALQIDHVDGGGAAERRSISSDGYLRRILREPERFQLLCANCHAIKTREEMGWTT